jgi:hypothetical protein
MRARLAWSLVAVYATGTIFFGVLARLNGEGVNLFADIPVLVAFGAYTAVGTLVIARYPRHPIGWIFVTVGVGTMIGNLGQQYAIYALFVEPSSSLPAAVAMGALGAWAWPAAMGSVVFLPLLLPNGRLASRRWRIVAWAAAAALGAVMVKFLFAPGPLDIGEQYPVANPLGIPGTAPLLNFIQSVGGILFLFVLASGVIGLLVRAYRSRGVERQQLKWFGSAAAFMVLAVFTLEPVVHALLPGKLGNAVGNSLFGVGIAALPVGTGIAILRWRLYDIDIIVNRTLVYASLTALLAVVYLGGVVAAGVVLRSVTGQERNNIAVAASTLAVAALFRPARRGVQGFIDRRFYRRKYDAEQTLADFSARLRDQTDLDTMRVELLRVVGETVQPAHASLWFRAPPTA